MKDYARELVRTVNRKKRKAQMQRLSDSMTPEQKEDLRNRWEKCLLFGSEDNWPENKDEGHR